MDDRLRREEKNTIVLQDRAIALEEKNRELIAMIRTLKKGGNADESIDELDESQEPTMNPVNLDLQYKLQEALRVNQILSKSRDVLTKTIAQMKTKIDKLAEKYKSQVDQLQSQLVEKEKEVKLHQMKLRQVYSKDSSSLIDEAIIDQPTVMSQRVSPNPRFGAKLRSKSNILIGGEKRAIKIQRRPEANDELKKLTSDSNLLPNPSRKISTTSSTKQFQTVQQQPSSVLEQQLPLIEDELRSKQQRDAIDSVL